MTDQSQSSRAELALEFTGERFTPECVREIWYEHWHRYAIAASLARGKAVLDLACGEGYGSALMARDADSVLGVDIDEAAIGHARRRYQADGLRFEPASATAVPAADDSFDLVVSFETIEHLAEQEQMLAEFRRVLRPDGVLLISSPDRARYSDETGYRNEFHVRELYRDEFESMLATRFDAVRLFGQQLMFHSCIWPLQPQSSAGLVSQTLALGKDGEMAIGENTELEGRPLYFVAACAAAERHLPERLEATWLFSDARQSVYEHYQHEIGKNMAAGELLAQRDARIAELEQQIEQLRQDRNKGEG